MREKTKIGAVPSWAVLSTAPKSSQGAPRPLRILRQTCGLHLIIFAMLISVTGCSSSSPIQPEQAITPLLAAGGGTAGWLASKGMTGDEQALITGAGTLGGLAVGSFIADQAEEAKRKEFRDGFNLARSNDITRLYWRQQAQHKAKDGQPQVKCYAFPARETGDDGEKIMKHDVVMPVLE